jgi:hypothetical protein
LLVGAILLAAVLRLLLSVTWRLVAGRVAVGVKLDLRNLMYRRLHRDWAEQTAA